MKRWVFNIVAGASLLLCVAVVALWIRSYWRQDAVLWWRHGAPGSCMSLVGGLSLQAYIPSGVSLGSQDGIKFLSGNVLDSAPPTPFTTGVLRFPQPFPPHLTHWGFAFHHTRDPARLQNSNGFIDTYWAAIPYWALALVTFIPFALLVVPNWYRRRRRIDRGLCPVCGYDLRATPERCPECGTVPPDLVTPKGL